jgi:glycoprotein endo-alpha-1,2-mannosidase
VYIYVTRIWRGEYARAIASLRATIKSRYGYDLYLVGDEVDWDGSPNADRIRLFDAITAYTMYSDLQTPGWPDNTGFLAGVRDRYSRFKAVADANGVRFIPNVLPAFNDRGVRLAAGHYALPHEVRPGIDGSYSLFEQFLGVAADFLNPQLPTLTVTSWNEWHEDTQIEPTAAAAPSSMPVEYTQGYAYHSYGFKLLELLQRFAAAHGG